MANDVRNELELMKRLLNALGQAVERLEQHLTRSEEVSAPSPSQPIPPPAPSVPPPPSVPPAPEVPPTAVSAAQLGQPQPAPPMQPTHAVRPPVPTPEPRKPFAFEEETTARELEQTLGGQIALWFGVALLFLAAVFFLSWAWTRLGPWARLAIGYFGGLALVELGWLSRRRSASWFVDGSIAAGLAILYLTTWAGLQRYEVMRFELAFTLMVATTAFGMGLAIGRDSQLLATLSVLGGFLTPVVLQSDGGAGKPLGFFTYLAVLNAGLLTVATRNRWELQRWLCLIATWILLMGWSIEHYREPLAGLVFGFITLYYALFMLLVLVPVFMRRVPTSDSDIALLAVATLLYVPAGQAVVMPLLGDYPAAFLAGLGALYLLLAWLGYRTVPEDTLLAGGFATLGIVLLTVAIPVQFKASVVAPMWNLEAMLLVALGIWYSSRLLYGLGLALWVLASLRTLIALSEAPTLELVLLNERGLALLSWVLGLMVNALVARSQALRLPESELDRLLPRVGLAIMAGLAALGGAVWLLTMETYYYFQLIGEPDSPLAPMLVSLEWTLLGVLLLIAGVLNRSRAVRLLGLATLTLTAFKLFLFDLGFLEMPYRTFSFAGLGLTLLIVSWLYSRYGTAPPTPQA
jgi:uncharacterized membrane protein